MGEDVRKRKAKTKKFESSLARQGRRDESKSKDKTEVSGKQWDDIHLRSIGRRKASTIGRAVGVLGLIDKEEDTGGKKVVQQSDGDFKEGDDNEKGLFKNLYHEYV